MNEKPTAQDIRASMPYLELLLDALPELKVVLAVGNDAKQGWAEYVAGRSRPELSVLACPHPGPTNMRTRPYMREQILAALRTVQTIIA
jgi:uracil-DNA glycosylase